MLYELKQSDAQLWAGLLLGGERRRRRAGRPARSARRRRVLSLRRLFYGVAVAVVGATARRELHRTQRRLLVGDDVVHRRCGAAVAGDQELEVVRAGRHAQGVLERDPTGLVVAQQRLVERLHPVELALGDYLAQAAGLLGI